MSENAVTEQEGKTPWWQQQVERESSKIALEFAEKFQQAYPIKRQLWKLMDELKERIKRAVISRTLEHEEAQRKAKALDEIEEIVKKYNVRLVFYAGRFFVCQSATNEAKRGMTAPTLVEAMEKFMRAIEVAQKGGKNETP